MDRILKMPRRVFSMNDPHRGQQDVLGMVMSWEGGLFLLVCNCRQSTLMFQLKFVVCLSWEDLKKKKYSHRLHWVCMWLGLGMFRALCFNSWCRLATWPLCRTTPLQEWSPGISKATWIVSLPERQKQQRGSMTAPMAVSRSCPSTPCLRCLPTGTSPLSWKTSKIKLKVFSIWVPAV